MSQKPNLPRWRIDHWRAEKGTLMVLAVALGLLIGIVAPASAQFFGFGGPQQPPPRPQRNVPQGGGGGFGWFGGGNDSPFFAPFQQQQAPKRAAPREDYSRAPSPEKRDAPAERNVLVLGDSMADWLAYGLEDAYAEQPDMGVIRKHKTVSGLLRYQPKGDPADWAAAAKGILATEKPDAIVVMLGLNDRVAIREPDKAAEKKGAKKDEKKDSAAEVKPGDKPAEPEADDADIPDPGAIVAERGARTGGMVDFRDERWGELYSKKIEEMINVVKAKGVPVLWVGLPAVRGTKATADMLYLDNLYRDAATKAGITYVDIWDGFVDEAGRFLQQGPDFEGQIRRLRSADGVYFSKAGARKMAHYVEREITRLLSGRSAPIALPSEPATPDLNAVPGAPAPRPLAGPIVPLVASSVGTDQLLGGPGVKPVSVDALVARVLVKGEPLAAPAGRADDFAWPRREIGREQAKGDVPVAAATPATSGTSGTAAATGPDGIVPVMAPPAAPKKKPKPVIATEAPSSFGSFFGFDEPRRAPVQQAPQRPRPAQAPGPRPPANVGPAASAPSGFFTR
ncbi:GDSL-type esterase/lipase family protein [Tardiphaga sp. 709]|uniref:SGNH/GDSL hydrolase family protein n=1 Tax=Tardiphaga sp. 709 TaxID=3076039 RepID=UPI0028E42EB5|nr:GDSL-type esterase/lipase family protein [Tardiphaga sp. 709]WNV12163.1 GDSL-type esterase/lipase family protein [Tardiphaga sp. 709]